MNSFPPRHYPDYGEISYATNRERIQNGAGHYVRGIPHLIPDVTYIVISEIVVDGDQSGTAETEHEPTIKSECS